MLCIDPRGLDSNPREKFPDTAKKTALFPWKPCAESLFCFGTFLVHTVSFIEFDEAGQALGGVLGFLCDRLVGPL